MAMINRRSMLRGGALVGSALVTPAFIWGCARRGEIGDASDRQRGLLRIVSDLVIPKTDTPSASMVGVPAFVELALKHGLVGSARRRIGAQGKDEPRSGGGIAVLGDLETMLDDAAGGNFPAAPTSRQHDVLSKIDASAFAPGSSVGTWHMIKDLILVGYYNSEIGASRELQYELVPGRYDPDLPMPANARAWSSDWTARDFG